MKKQMQKEDYHSGLSTGGIDDPSTQIKQQIGPIKQAVVEAFLTAKPLLNRVEERLRAKAASDAELLTAISQYLLNQGGKRIRPLLTILSNRLFRPGDATDQLIDVAAGIELIHMATLLHDDIIDKSPVRRHKRSAYSEYGLTPSLLAGDFLLVRAFGLCAHLDSVIVNLTEEACVALTEGEMLEGLLDSDHPRTLDDYLNIVGKKTAALFALAGAVGAHLAETDEENVEHMKQFGYLAGIAFQMVDDVLDIVADEDLLGKPSGTDLRQKTPSLVNILWLNSKDPKASDFFKKTKVSVKESMNAVEHLKSSPIIEECRSLAHDYARKANDEISLVAAPNLDARIRSQLFAIVQYTLDRCL